MSYIAAFNDGTIIVTGITCKKVCGTQHASGLLLKLLKYLEAMLKSFEFKKFPSERN